MNTSTFNRRQFLQRLVAGSAALAGSSLLPMGGAHAASSIPRTLVNLMLYGGADLRFAFAPDPLSADPAYIEQYWQARRALYGSYSDYASLYAGEFTTVGNPLSFGLHNSCGWLIQQFQQGNAAIAANTYGSLNRRHDHSQLIIESGDLQASRSSIDRDGWGGRMVENIGGQPNVLELSNEVQTFCNGSNPRFRLAQVIHAQNTRDMGAPRPSANGNSSDDNLIRAISAYYRARGQEIAIEKPDNWPFRKFFQHYASITEFDAALVAQLENIPIPNALQSLDANSSSFEQQCRNLFDACQVPDILNYRVMSMSYGGWDTHTNEYDGIVSNLSGMLGSNGGLATVTAELSAQANDNLVFHLTSDFGRQLAANGANGTDHGRGSYTIMIGKPLRGGTYGEMFPAREALPDPYDSQGRSPFQIPGRDIEGRTSLEHIWTEHANWLQPGIAAQVFPNTGSSPIESAVSFSNLYV